ncbi:hypothetical protein [Erythrobacter sp. HKB08]|uniref:hypothetical protein n=1 Tax=Erythrobacter sp. HKB08 TaxID=2502843 RepID=UPI001008883D|nr:hypothetical protein [Erythrobacter sp. HKB08]
MSAEALVSVPKAPARPRRRTAADRLRCAILQLAGGRGEVMQHDERSWASVTFSGSRHALRLVFEGEEAVEAGEALVAALPDHEFTLPGHLVADATISAVEHTLVPEPRMLVECEVLLLEEA